MAVEKMKKTESVKSKKTAAPSVSSQSSKAKSGKSKNPRSKEKDTKTSKNSGGRRIKIKVVDAAPERYFFVHNGPALKNLRELLDTLGTMSDNQFYHHVTYDKNDFAIWIADTLDTPNVARALLRAATRHDAIAALNLFFK